MGTPYPIPTDRSRQLPASIIGSGGHLFKPSRGEFIYISAQRNDDDLGTIRCRIKVDGVTVVENESSGPYTIATCSMSM